MKIFYFGFFICISFASNFSGGTEMNEYSPQNVEITLESQFGNNNPFIPLLIGVKPSKAIYEDFRWSIKILHVLADGKFVEPKLSTEIFDDVNSRSVTTSGDVFIYKTKFNDLLIGELKSDGEYSLTEFSIPYDVHSLDICYQFVYRDGTKSTSIYRLKAYRVD